MVFWDSPYKRDFVFFYFATFLFGDLTHIQLYDTVINTVKIKIRI